MKTVKPAISFQDVSKTFRIREKGFKRDMKAITAVNQLSFSVSPGEILGLIGLNGSGKTTTIKMACGVMKPDSGEILSDGDNPFKRKKSYLQKVSLVMGQKSRLDPDLSILDAILMYASFYGILPAEAVRRAGYFAEIIQLQETELKKQVRKLSLGQRMKGELTLAFIHNPRIIFLDEPTLGLDFLTQRRIRAFLKRYCEEQQAAMILTSHDIDDIETLSDRLLLIDRGTRLFYGTRSDLKKLIPAHSIISFDSDRQVEAVLKDVLWHRNDNGYRVEIGSEATQAFIQRLLRAEVVIENLTIHDIGLESLIEEVFKVGSDV